MLSRIVAGSGVQINDWVAELRFGDAPERPLPSDPAVRALDRPVCTGIGFADSSHTASPRKAGRIERGAAISTAAISTEQVLTTGRSRAGSTGVPAFCRVCHHGCPILVGVEDGRVVSVTGDPANDVFSGYTCVKGRDQVNLYRRPDRLLRPLKRTSEGFVPLSMESALDGIAEKLDQLRERHGPRSIALYHATMVISNVATVAVAHAFLAAIGSPMFFTPTTIDQPGKHIARAFHGAWMGTGRGCDDPEVVMLLGINPLVSHSGLPAGNPGKWLAAALRRGMRLVVIDPRRTEVARRATIHIQPRPGNDVAIVAAMIRVILEEKLYDEAFLAADVAGVEELRRAVAPFGTKEVAGPAGIEPDDLVEAARIFASAGRGYAVAGTGSNMAGHGTVLEYLLLCLQSLCGFWRRAGEAVPNPGVIMPRVPPKAQAAPPYPAYGYGTDMRVRGLTESRAGLPVAALSEEILLEGDGQVRALVSIGGNPALAWPDQIRTVEALETLELFVQVDPFMSATAQLADYVLPTKLSLEMAGMTTVLDSLPMLTLAGGTPLPWAQYCGPVVDPPAGADVLEDWEVLYGIGQRLGLQLTLESHLPGVNIEPRRLDMVVRPSTDDIFDLMSTGSRVPLDEVRRHPHGGVFVDPPVVVAPKDSGWDVRLDVGNPEMMAELADLVPEPTGQEGDLGSEDACPFHLLCRRVMHAYNSSVHDIYEGRRPTYNPAYMHPDDLARLGIAAGQLVEIRSPRSSIVGVAAPDGSLRRGLVSMTHNYGSLPGEGDADPRSRGANTNRLLVSDTDFDRFSGQPRMSGVPVSVTPYQLPS